MSSHPLEPFDSGLEWEEQPVHTGFCLEFVQLPIKDWRDLDGKSFEMTEGDADGSIYLGATRNPVDIHRMEFARVDGSTFRLG